MTRRIAEKIAMDSPRYSRAILLRQVKFPARYGLSSRKFGTG